MNLNQIIDKRFEENLELAREEMEQTCPDNSTWSYKEVWNMAREWTLDDVFAEIAIYIDNKWTARQERINQAFYK